MNETIEYFGECTAYSAKGHFKSADFRRLFTYTLIVVNIVVSIFSMIDLFNDMTIKIMGAFSLLASVLILMYQTKVEADYISNSMKMGEEYLKLHNDIYVLFSSKRFSDTDVIEIKERVNKLNSKNKPAISYVGKKWAKKSIEKNGEMKIWWK